MNALPETAPGRRHGVWALLLVAVVFGVDLCLPLGVASAVPYTFAVLLALQARPPRFGVAVALLCGFLTLAKMAIVPDKGETEWWKVIANRCLALFAIGMTAYLGVRRRRAEEQTRHHLADLAHLGRLKVAGQLAAGLAHELNQPLAAVCLQAELAARATDPAARDVALNEIAEQSQRAAEIIRTLRRMIQRGEPGREPLDINAVVREVARLADWEARRAGVDVRLHLADDLPAVAGDPIQLEQVVLNLLQNAFEAGAKVVRVRTMHDSGGVRVVVHDSGAGLTAAECEKIFERFYTTKPTGMGLGLAISRSIVESHGGKLWAEPGDGATFAFRLPAAGGVR